MESFNKALKYAFALLRYRPRSQDEIRRRLIKKKATSTVVDEVIKYLKSCNYLDDREFVKSYITSCRLKGWGPIRADFNLKKFGISDELREKGLKELEGQSSELINKLLEKKIQILKNSNFKLDKKKTKQKIAKFLTDRGFRYEDIAGAVQELNSKLPAIPKTGEK